MIGFPFNVRLTPLLDGWFKIVALYEYAEFVTVLDITEREIFGAIHGLWVIVIVSTSAPHVFVAVTLIVFNPEVRFTGNSIEFDALV